MKVQGINNQNYISHKAYFKPNAEFKKLWAFRPTKTETFADKLQKVRTKLPNHEIEIIDSGKALIDEKLQNYFLLFNNFTKKSFGVAIAATSVKNHLETVFDCLLEKNKRTENFFDDEITNSLDYDDITTRRIH